MMLLSRRALLGAGAAGAAMLAGCQTPAATATPPADPGASLAALLDRTAIEILRRSPERATSLGVSEAQAGGRYIDRVSDVSKEAQRAYRSMLETAVRELSQIDRNALTSADAVTLDVVRTSFENSVANSRFEAGGGAGAPYVVTQLTGVYSSMPDFLSEQHPLRTREHAEAYIARIESFVGQLDQETNIIGEDAGAGVIPPDFAIDRALEQLNTFVRTAPSQTNLVQALARRLPDNPEVPESERAAFVARAEAAVRDRVMPAYQRQMDALRAVRPRAVHEAGVWRLPQGAEMYRAALRSRTTTEMSPDEIHRTGTELIAQFNSEMDAILRAQGMTRGSVAQRIQALSRRRDQLYPNTDAGRQQILDDLNAQTREITALMPRAFNTLAQAPLEIRRVPVFTEAGAPGGYYQRAALDGSRPGAYYINLRNTAEWPRFTLPTLNYHEGVPGHHWQISIQQEAGDMPFIRRALLGFSAFSEGWALYAEQLADELGIYNANPLGRLGYLQSATFRASRLVVDTGMHHLRWSREQAIRSMMEATGDQESSVTTEIERYAVWPGQACSYMVGRLEINRLRDQARATLGDQFDLKSFHDIMLRNGAVPLSVLERIMQEWAATVSGPSSH
ncbi:MAG: DUF885 domain-containing protein [Hyphomonadaceae bacterium]|nr:DUF885 domain-containing protein [Hyphomonadaceae bacterium]MBX3510460.1 DUF885 domain-containing protein [Hyphomonadaceae bacterium]